MFFGDMHELKGYDLLIRIAIGFKGLGKRRFIMSNLSKATSVDATSLFRGKTMLKASCSAVLIMTLGACSGGNAQVNMAQHQANTELVSPEVSGENSFELLADRMAEAGDHAAAVPLYRHLLQANSFNSAVQAKLGLSLLALGNTHEAGRALGIAVKNGQKGKANYGLGKVHLALGRYSEAADQFYAAAVSGDARAYTGRGIALAALGNFDEAMAAFDDGLNTNPEDMDAISNKALTLALLGSPDVAIDMLENVAQNGLAGPRDRQNLAFAYLGLQDVALMRWLWRALT